MASADDATDPRVRELTTDPDPLGEDEFLSKVDPAALNRRFNDRVDTFAGTLHVNMVDIVLPGAGGLDIVIQRYYESSIWNRVDNPVLTRHAASADPGGHLGGNGWQLHLGKIVDPNAAGIGSYPLLVMPDGSTHPLYNRSGHTGERVTPRGWVHSQSSGVHSVVDTNGVTYFFDSNADGASYQDYHGTAVIQCTRVEDVNGNAIVVEYDWVESLPPYRTSRIESVEFADAGDNRVVEFAYATGTNRIETIRVKAGSSTVQTWDHQYSVSHSVTQPDSNVRVVYNLDELTPPEGDSWEFDYHPGGTTHANGRYQLKEVILPTGALIEYSYRGEAFDTGTQSCLIEFSVVNERGVTDRGPGGDEIGTWTYTYDDPGQEGAETTVAVRDGSDAVVRTETVTHHGWDAYSFNDPEMWRVGLPYSSVVSIPSVQTTTISTSWERGSSLSADTRQTSNWVGCGSLRQMAGQTFTRPDARTVTVVRDSSSYATTESDLDDYHNVGQVDESSTDGLSRTTELRYWSDVALNIMVGRVSEIDPDPGGTTCVSYDSKGRVEHRHVSPRTDGSCTASSTAGARTTTYTYDTDGNLIREFRENGFSDYERTHSDFEYGSPTKTTVENGGSDIHYCGEIGPLETVESDTDGRGGSCPNSTYQTDYEVDDLGRLTEVDPPIGLPTSVDYAVDWSTVTLTRGSYDVRYTYDGLGRLVERHDLETGHRVVQVFDPFGVVRRRELWYPDGEDSGSAEDAGDVTVFDPLGRPTSVIRPDGLTVEFSYDGSEVVRTDEESRQTTFDFEAFGRPEDRRLAALVDADGHTTSYSYDPVWGLLDEVDAPGSKGDRSFEYYTGKSDGSNGLLEWEEHPETGRVEYEYDSQGNVTKRERANGAEDTLYDYDRAMRLVEIDYPFGTPDVDFEYDEAGNRTLVDSTEGVFEYEYDEAGRLEVKRSLVEVGGPTRTFEMIFDYDDMDRLERVTYPSGREVDYGFDNRGWVTTVDEPSPSAAAYVDDVTYHPTGAANVHSYANGLERDTGLDERHRLHLLRVGDPPFPLMDVEVLYDGAGNVTDWVDHRDGGATRTFVYDALDRLEEANAPGLWGVLGFSYDALGNRETKTLAGATTTYWYDSSNRLESLSGAEVASFAYDAQGRPTDADYEDRRPPGEVSGLDAEAFGTSIVLSWTNPSDPDLDTVLVYRKTTGFPTGVGDGELVCSISPASPGGEELCVDDDAALPVWRFYLAVTQDEVPNSSAGSQIRASRVTCPECDADLMIGLISGPVKALENTGEPSPTTPQWTERSEWDVAVSLPSGNPSLGDLDNDGDKDLVVGVSAGVFRVFELDGPPHDFEWQEHTGSGGDTWKPTWDVGSVAAPALGDLDLDGDLDLLAGNSAGQLEAFENVGDALGPVWAVAPSSWTSTLNDVGSYASPVLADLDGDGSLDLLVGRSNGDCVAYVNEPVADTEDGTVVPVWVRTGGWDIPDEFRSDATPALADLDADGDLDALVGSPVGSCDAYENTGTPTSPVWTRRAGWDVADLGSNSAPALGDIDQEKAELSVFADGFESGTTALWSETYPSSGATPGVWTHIPPAGDRRGTRTQPLQVGAMGRRVGPESRAIGVLVGSPWGGAEAGSRRLPTPDQYDYTFNAADDLTEVSWQFGTLTTATYDGDGLRIRKVEGGEEVVYLRDPSGNVLAEYDGNNTLLAEYVYLNGRQVARVEPDGGSDRTTFIHSDHLGTSVVLSNAGGAEVWRGEYFPFGTPYSSAGAAPRYRFSERELDHSTNLYYMRARYYDPNLGRFLSIDPVGGDVQSSQSWNRYSYVQNNPLKYTDPTGKFLDTVLDVGFVVYDVGVIVKDNIIGGTTEGLGTNLAALGGDVVGAAVPFMTGGGIAVRGGAKLAGKADNLVDGARAADNAQDVAQSSQAARREAMREAGTPTSRPATSQSGPPGNRQTVVEGADGTPRVQTQHQPDAQHPNPHWHDATPKVDPATGEVRRNSYGQIKEQSQGRTTAEYTEGGS